MPYSLTTADKELIAAKLGVTEHDIPPVVLDLVARACRPNDSLQSILDNLVSPSGFNRADAIAKDTTEDMKSLIIRALNRGEKLSSILAQLTPEKVQLAIKNFGTVNDLMDGKVSTCNRENIPLAHILEGNMIELATQGAVSFLGGFMTPDDIADTVGCIDRQPIASRMAANLLILSTVKHHSRSETAILYPALGDAIENKLFPEDQQVADALFNVYSAMLEKAWKFSEALFTPAMVERFAGQSAALVDGISSGKIPQDEFMRCPANFTFTKLPPSEVLKKEDLSMASSGYSPAPVR